MNYDELAFVNQQLAAMLRSGIPLEGALRQLCIEMQRGTLRDELTALEADLAKGTPLADALAARRLPEFYVRTVRAGAKGNDLPGMLLLLADHYGRVNSLWTRLKGLMVYPLIVLVTATALSVLSAFLLTSMITSVDHSLIEFVDRNRSKPDLLMSLIWAPAVLLVIGTAVFLAGLVIPSVRRSLRWRLPGSREAALSRFASAMHLLLRGGNTLEESLGLMAHLEQGTPAANDLALWRERLKSGCAKVQDVTAGSRTFPPLFRWMLANAGEDLSTGFSRAADFYHARAVHRTETLLYAALPVTVLCLGLMIVMQVQPVIQIFQKMLQTLGGGG